MHLIHFLLSTSWVSLIAAVFFGFISGTSSAMLIALINTALETNPSKSIYIGGFVSLSLLHFITNIGSDALLIRLSQGAIFNLRMLLCRRILASPLRHLESVGIPRLLATLTDDVKSVSNAALLIPMFSVNLAIVIGCLLYLGSLSWIALTWTIGFVIFGILSYQLPMNKASLFMSLARKKEDHLFKHFRSITEGIKELKLNYQRRQEFVTEELKPTLQAYRKEETIGLTILSAGSNWGNSLGFVFIGLLLFILPTLQAISVPILSSYILTAIYLLGPIGNCIGIVPALVRASVALGQIQSLGLSLVEHSVEEQLDTPPDLIADWRCIKFIDVTHTYYRELDTTGSFSVGPINLTLYPGELVFIIGGNGSGKSTLAKLLAGLYIPETGKICVDNQPISDKNREWYRQLFSVVFSDFYLFDRIMGVYHPDIENRIKDYLVKLQLNHKVEIKQSRLSTTALSQGQRKRLVLLTAYLEDRPIYLFDEWASDQDPEFKEFFYTQLLLDLKSTGKTLIAISHDERYFDLADRIIKLDYGRIFYDKYPNRKA